MTRRMITRNKAAAKTSRGKKRRVSDKNKETEKISHFQKFINGQITNDLVSVIEGIKRILKLKEIEVNTLKVKVESLERSKDETDKEYFKLKQDFSRVKSCVDCKTKGEEIKTLTKCVEKKEKETQKLLEHNFTKKMKIEKYLAIIKERDEKIEDLEIELAELEETETTRSTETMETKQTKCDSLNEKEDVEVKSKPADKGHLLQLIDTTLLSISSNKESSETEEKLKNLKKKSKTKIITSTSSISARPGELGGQKSKKTNKRNRS